MIRSLLHTRALSLTHICTLSFSHTHSRTRSKDAGARLYVLNGPDLVSQNQGESEAGLRAVFGHAAANAPAVVFIDEVDALAPSREATAALAQGSSFSDRITAELLGILDGLSAGEGGGAGGVALVAATNRIDAVDKSVRRPGRFDYEVERTLTCTHAHMHMHTHIYAHTQL